jgi:hypothetical protein
MSLDDLIKNLEYCRKYDQEEGHIKADEFLLEYINDKRVTDAFESISKWYA